MSRRWYVVLLVSVLAVVAAVAFVVVPDVAGDTARPQPSRTSAPSPPVQRSAASAVLEGSTPGSADPAKVRQAVAAALSSAVLGSHVGATVLDAGTGSTLLDVRSADLVAPASTAKLLTATAALATLGAEHRFTTSVVQGAPGQLVLVGGGDPLLSRTPSSPTDPQPTSIQALAERTAATLKTAGTAAVSLGFDDALFDRSLPASWPPSYLSGGIVSATGALALDGGRIAPDKNERSPDPGAAAAADFAARLVAQGIAVTGPPVRTTAPAAAALVARVQSAPLEDVVEHVLLLSDDDGAELLARAVAVATGVPSTPDSAGRAVLGALSGLGLDVGAARLLDGSGLSRDDRASAALLTSVLRLVSSPEHPGLRAVVTGLPTAAFTGTLDNRFRTADDRVGVGTVRAKTGTLTGVNSLAGVVTGADGRTYVFAFLSDTVSSTDAARDAFDRAAAGLAGCGCLVG